MSSIHDQVRRTVMAHCFRRLRDMPEDDIDVVLTFLQYTRTASARAKEAKDRADGRSPQGRVAALMASPLGAAKREIAESPLGGVKVEPMDLASPPHRSSFIVALPVPNNEYSSGSQSQPVVRDQRSVKVTQLAAELRRMTDAVYGLQIGVLIINDLCILGHILNIKRATDYIVEYNADFEEAEHALFGAMGSPAQGHLGAMPSEDGSSTPVGQGIGAATAAASAAKKRKRHLSKNVMVAELDDYHRTAQPQQKRERRSAIESVLSVPCVLEPKGKAAKAAALTREEKAAQKRQEKEAAAAEKTAAKILKATEKEAVKAAKAAAKGGRGSTSSIDGAAGVAAVSAVTAADGVASPAEKKGRRVDAAPAPAPAHKPRPAVLGFTAADAPQMAEAPKPKLSLLASLGLDPLVNSTANDASRRLSTVLTLDDDDDDFLGITSSKAPTIAAPTVNDDEDEEEYEYEEIIEEVDEDEDYDDTPQGALTSSTALQVVSGSVFKQGAGNANYAAPKPATFDISADPSQKDAADFLLKQVVLQGTLSTAKGAELLIKRGVPFVPIDPVTGQAVDGVEAAPQTSPAIAEKFVSSVFKVFHRQEKVAYDHGVAYIY